MWPPPPRRWRPRSSGGTTPGASCWTPFAGARRRACAGASTNWRTGTGSTASSRPCARTAPTLRPRASTSVSRRPADAAATLTPQWRGCRFDRHPVLRERHRRLPGAAHLRPGQQRGRPVRHLPGLVRAVGGQRRPHARRLGGGDGRQPPRPLRDRRLLQPGHRPGDALDDGRRQPVQHHLRAAGQGLHPQRPKIPGLDRRQRLLRDRPGLLRRPGQPGPGATTTTAIPRSRAPSPGSTTAAGATTTRSRPTS